MILATPAPEYPSAPPRRTGVILPTRPLSLAPLATALSLLLPAAALADLPSPKAPPKLKVGDPAPSFNLPNLKGTKIASTSFSGKPAVLVIGTARESAEACRDWMLTLDTNFKESEVAVFQIIVLNNPWYIPNFAVVDKIESFVPRHGHRKVLLEWKLTFGERYGIPYDFDPRVVVIDRAGTIRLWHQGNMNDAALARIIDLLTELQHEKLADPAAATPAAGGNHNVAAQARGN